MLCKELTVPSTTREMGTDVDIHVVCTKVFLFATRLIL
jgi:hypothetical protein